MKKFIVSIALFAFSSAFLAKADELSTRTDTVSTELRGDLPTLPGKPHRIPGRSVITCKYANQRMYFDFPGALLRVTVTHENSGFRGEYVISSELPFVTITPEVGLYRIEAITEDQRYYYGEITL